mgnify:FL=1
MLLPIYGVIASLGYIILIPVQGLFHRVMKGWSLVTEMVFIFLYTVVCLIASYIYYKSGIINGTYGLFEFIFGQYYPIFLIMLPIIILSRWFIFRKKVSQRFKSSTITLKGDNKLDFLTIELSDLVCISSANNYIEVHYLEDKNLRKKLLRRTLTQIHSFLPMLIKVHRSYLINPVHLRSWKDSKTLHLTKMEVPVSKKYRDEVLRCNHSSLKPDISPQTA